MKLFLAPHNDDETLWGSFTIIPEQPTVLIVYDSVVQAARGLEISAPRRRMESVHGMKELVDYMPRFLGIPDSSNEPVEEALALWAAVIEPVTQVWAPAIEENGHEQHNAVGRAADLLWPGKVTHYLTYTRTGGKSRNGTNVAAEGAWITRKLNALACYRSQIEIDATGAAPHFLNDLYEYYEHAK